MANNNSKSGGVGFFSLLFLLFLGLKLTNNIDWSWWWVTSPLWLPITIVIGVIMIILMFKD
jgi:ABC-type multidrug transport system permease subunit